ncbi:hypothetical protein CXF85_19860 [Colwellia sp. 75C3]|uniref:hypothetical protein n=1 Tax=Colwellia sp. 75C3 TaxID=888425 RepID=UPI000C331967|nr:hypothetical protein [Colwellia sp. 75C3]PKG81021.1 hypothetical protein CXF85_19860 [Colwellia sp. 75C3]
MSIIKPKLLQHQVTTDSQYIELYQEFTRLTGKAYPVNRDGVFLSKGMEAEQYNRNLLLDYELYANEFNKALNAVEDPTIETEWLRGYHLKALVLGRKQLSQYGQGHHN